MSIVGPIRGGIRGAVNSTGGRRLLLDTLAVQPVAAYSLRKLRSGYSGSAIRVRRSSDNAEQDIGFVAGVLDTASLLTFCGVGNGFVVTWYSQVGATNVTNATAADQPTIVTAGAVLSYNSKPAMVGRGTVAGMDGADVLGGTAASLVAYTAISEIGSAYFDIAFNTATGSAGRVGAILPLGGGSAAPYYWDCGSDGAGERLFSAGVSVANALTLTTLVNIAATPSQQIWRNGTLIASDASASAAPTNALRVCFQSTNAYHEALVFNSAASFAQRAAITANQGTFYGVTVA